MREVGDLFFSLITLANLEGINLNSALLETIKKYKTRDKFSLQQK